MKLTILTLFLGCSPDPSDPPGACVKEDFFDQYASRNFKMGFSSWPYAPTNESVNDTYQFLSNYGDIYSEHIDSNIPWEAWINNTALPEAFVNDITGRKSRKLAGTELTVSVSVLNTARNQLAPDYNGDPPASMPMNDEAIADAYVKHLQYIVNELEPDYLIIAIEVNELLVNAPQKWPEYKALMDVVRPRIRQLFPSLPLSESVTLHNLYKPEVPHPADFVQEVAGYVNQLDFAAISFYPFFKGLNNQSGFEDALDFLHTHITSPVAFAETSHLSENLDIPGLSLAIPGDPCEQNAWLETLAINALEQDYQYIIWWAHRDYNDLWETFPAEIKDLGKIWLSNGIINEDGKAKKSFATWQKILAK